MSKSENLQSAESTEAIRTRLAHIFEEKLGREAPPDDADLFNSGVLDSLAFVDMLVGIEAEFGMTLGLDTIEFERFQTVDGIIAFIKGEMMPEAANS